MKPTGWPAWQPIEGAPRDGTIVLLGGGVWGDVMLDDAPRVMAARWLQRGQIGFWTVSCGDGDDRVFPYERPTHWMPLPHPP